MGYLLYPFLAMTRNSTVLGYEAEVLRNMRETWRRLPQPKACRGYHGPRRSRRLAFINPEAYALAMEANKAYLQERCAVLRTPFKGIKSKRRRRALHKTMEKDAVAKAETCRRIHALLHGTEDVIMGSDGEIIPGDDPRLKNIEWQTETALVSDADGVHEVDPASILDSATDEIVTMPEPQSTSSTAVE